ncbi:hypothetical protein JI58_04795 [Marinosulfonomonas sp. PRT-SC04]|nr:hypothetical protein JI58_04795 [Marinosulfonomonas sp. PRT-SC04]
MPETTARPQVFSKALFWILAVLPFVLSILKYSRWETYGTFDFYAFHMAGILANEGQAMLAYDWDRFVALFGEQYGSTGSLPWFYPPILLPYAQALALFQVSTAYLVFCFSSLASYYLTVYFLFRSQFKEIIILSAFPLIIPIAFGHPTILFLVALLLAYRLSRHAPVLALIALTLIATKPHVGGIILFLYFLKTAPRSILPSLAIAVVAIISTSLFYGSDIWFAFLAHLKEASQSVLSSQIENPFRASVYVALAPYDMPAFIRWLLHLTTLVAICGLGAYAFKDEKTDRFWVVAGIAAFFTSPYIVLYDYTLLLFPLILVLKNSDIQTSRPWVLAVLFIEFIPMALIEIPPAYKFNFSAIMLFTVAVLMVKIKSRSPNAWLMNKRADP